MPDWPAWWDWELELSPEVILEPDPDAKLIVVVTAYPTR
jgi:hypothetical protein